MTGLVRRVRRAAAGGAAVAVVLAGAVACSGDDEDGPDASKPGSSASDPEQEPINTTVDGISGRLDDERRTEVQEGVSQTVDAWFEGAFLGDFPREDYSAAFDGFTKGARKDAMAQLDLLSNKEIDGQIDNAVAGNRRVRLEVLAPKGEPQGVTAHFVLDFFTYGELEEHRRVRGSLYLTPEKGGEWQVFGYDVLGATAR